MIKIINCNKKNYLNNLTKFLDLRRSGKKNENKKISKILKDIKSMNKKNKTELSIVVAEKLAKKAQDKKITKIYFDRGRHRYHGRIKVFAETLRKNGLVF